MSGWALSGWHLAALLALAAAPALAAGKARTPPAPAPQGGDWLPRGTAVVQTLDKVNAEHGMLIIPVGGTASYGALTISAQSCVVRPPNEPKDSAAYLVIQDSHPGAPGFTGWMFASAPEVSMLEHPIYDVRVLGCR